MEIYLFQPIVRCIVQFLVFLMDEEYVLMPVRCIWKTCRIELYNVSRLQVNKFWK